nr:MAG TPA: hypothetical protein [Inoviridae sp.]
MRPFVGFNLSRWARYWRQIGLSSVSVFFFF